MRRQRIRSPEQIRLTHIMELQQALLDHMYVDRQKKQDQALYMLLKENQALLMCIHPTFIFNSKWYSAASGPILISDKPNRAIHKTIRPKVEALLSAPEFEWEQENAKISNYFGLLLKRARHLDDLRTCLPWQLHNTLIGIQIDSIFNIGQSMHKHEVDKFKLDNKEGLHCLNCIYIKKLLVS